MHTHHTHTHAYKHTHTHALSLPRSIDAGDSDTPAKVSYFFLNIVVLELQLKPELYQRKVDDCDVYSKTEK